MNRRLIDKVGEFYLIHFEKPFMYAGTVLSGYGLGQGAYGAVNNSSQIEIDGLAKMIIGIGIYAFGSFIQGSIINPALKAGVDSGCE